MKRLRVGMVGAGQICPFHLQAISRVGFADVVGIADLNLKRARQIANQFQIPLACTTVRQLADAGADVVHVLTPPSSHAALAIEALEQGCHVLVEKPLATSVADCDRIAEAAQRVGKTVGVNHSNLRDPFVRQALEAVRRGEIGDVLSVSYLRGSSYPPYRGGALPPQYRDGGYPFRDMGVHALYTISEFLGDIEDVQAVFASQGGDPHLLYDEWAATVRCARGIGQIRMSWNARPMQSQLIVEGTRGVFRADLFAMYLIRRRTLRLPGFVERVANAMDEARQIATQVPLNVLRCIRGRIQRYHGLQALVREFYESLAAGKLAPVTVAAAKPIVKWTERIASQADSAKQRFVSKFAQAPTAPVLLTGATGFIGRRVLARLLERGERVRILARREPSDDFRRDPRVEIVLGDLGDSEAVSRAVHGTEVIYHVGATMQGNEHDFERGTVVGTQNVVDAILQSGVGRLVYVSSLSVLHATAASECDFVDERWPLEPNPERRGFYTASKLRAERIVSAAVQERGLPAIILRPGQVFGPGGPLLTSAVARRAKHRLIVLGNGRVTLPLVYVEDVVDAILAAGDSRTMDGTILHLTDVSTVTQNDLVREFIERSPHPLRAVHIPKMLVYGLALAVGTAFQLLRRRAPLSLYRVRSALRSLRFESDAALRVLEWRPRVGVERGLELTFSSLGLSATRASGDGVDRGAAAPYVRQPNGGRPPVSASTGTFVNIGTGCTRPQFRQRG